MANHSAFSRSNSSTLLLAFPLPAASNQFVIGQFSSIDQICIFDPVIHRPVVIAVQNVIKVGAVVIKGLEAGLPDELGCFNKFELVLRPNFRQGHIFMRCPVSIGSGKNPGEFVNKSAEIFFGIQDIKDFAASLPPCQYRPHRPRLAF